MERATALSLVGAGTAGPDLQRLAYETGRRIAAAGCVLVCGGLGGVMEAACRGAREAGGRTVGILPGIDPGAANPWVEVAVATGMGHARNAVVVQSGRAVVALPGSWGTLSEVALALKVGRPVVGLGAWGHVEGVRTASTPAEAVARALAAAEAGT
ncbi:MAG: TIGR00725 family protein [Deferrisomatales bacterium]